MQYLYFWRRAPYICEIGTIAQIVRKSPENSSIFPLENKYFPVLNLYADSLN